MSVETTAFVGLGGNLGDPERQMAQALRQLNVTDGIEVAAVSPIYRTPPWGVTDQPDFLNACARLRTTLGAEALLAGCLAVEEQLKRRRDRRWGPRLVDIDLLVFGTERIDEPGLRVPHPHMLERAFVLLPLADLAPVLEIEGRRVEDWAKEADRAGIVPHRTGGSWWRDGD